MKPSVLVLCFLALASVAVAAPAFINEEVQRNINLSGHVVTSTHDITLRSVKASSSKYLFALEEELVDAVAHIEAVDEDDVQLSVRVGDKVYVLSF